MKLYLAQINPTVGDITGNTRLIRHALTEAKKADCQLALFPELCLTGYPPEDLLLLPHFIHDVENALLSLLPDTQGITAIVGTVRHNPDKKEKPLYNTAAILTDGKLVGYQDKSLLPTYDVFDERRFFQPASSIRLWPIAGKQVAITICEDIWQHSYLLTHTEYELDPVDKIAALKPDLILNLSASPFSLGKLKKRLQVCSKAAKSVNAPLLFCNQVGGNDSLIFDGTSLYVNNDGSLLAYAKGFKEDHLIIDLDQKGHEVYYAIDHNEELFQALVLGLKDYFKKLNFTKACIGLSGGIDSAIVAYIAVAALGKENVLGVLMPSRYSSPDSITDAEQLAKTLGMATTDISIEPVFKTYIDCLSTPLGSITDGITEENIQARIRGMILMAISNKSGHIVLSTGNKSEMAMGYSTLYGDMCGGLAIISDVTKQQIYSLTRWINRIEEIIPRSTIEKPPSAELRPNQKDSDSLPEYSIVDNILHAYIVECLSPQEITSKFDYKLPLVNELILKIHRNEYKRRQGPPCLRVSEKAFSIGRRFPIVQRYVK